MLPRPTALGRAWRRRPLKPSAAVALLYGAHDAAAFRRIVEEVFPDAAGELLAAREANATREEARVRAFLRRVEAELFPVYECEEYAQVAAGIPFVREGWSYERFHHLEHDTGDLLLLALCAHPYADDGDARTALLDLAGTRVPRALLARIPPGGLTPAELHARLDGGPYAALGSYADWLWGETGSAFLDLDDEMVVEDAEWTRENVALLAEQWRRAEAILDGIAALARWLAGEPAARFARLLAAALGDATAQPAEAPAVPSAHGAESNPADRAGQRPGGAICGGVADGHRDTAPGELAPDTIPLAVPAHPAA